MSKILILPVEIQARELHAKIILALIAAQDGFCVWLGRNSEINSLAQYLPPGIFVDKDATAHSREKFHALKKIGHSICVIDEEGLVNINDIEYTSHRLNHGALELLDAFFAWGENHRNRAVSAHPWAADKILAVGNPRIDMLTTKAVGILSDRGAEHRRVHGKYILVNTNFECNVPSGNIEKYISDAVMAQKMNKKEEEMLRGMISFSQKMMQEFMRIIPLVRRNLPDQKVIIRPHPSERHEVWEDYASQIDGVEAIYEGSAVEWISGADLLLHNGCTTAIEASLMGVPAVAYAPFEDPVFSLDLPNSVSYVARNGEELSDLLKAVIIGKRGAPCYAVPRLSEHISSISGGACSAIMRHLNQLQPISTKKNYFKNLRTYRVKRAAVEAYVEVNSIYRRMRGLRVGNLTEHYRDPKVQDVISVMGCLASYWPEIVRNVSVDEPFQNCYRIIRRGT